MKIDRKKFIQTSDSGFYFDSYNDVLYIPNAIKFNLDYLRKYIALMLTLSLYVFLFRYYFKYRKKTSFYLVLLLVFLFYCYLHLVFQKIILTQV